MLLSTSAVPSSYYAFPCVPGLVFQLLLLTVLMFLVGLMLLRLTELMQISGTRFGLRQVLLVQVYSSRSRDPLRSGISTKLEDLGGGSSR